MAASSKKGTISYQQYLDALHTVRLYSKQIDGHRAEIKMDMDSVSRFLSVTEDTKIVDLPLTTRTMNVLKGMDGLDSPKNTLKDMENISLTAISEQKNAGKRTMLEIEELLIYSGIEMLP